MAAPHRDDCLIVEAHNREDCVFNNGPEGWGTVPMDVYTEAVWIGVMGCDTVTISVIERGQMVLVTRPTLNEMGMTLIVAGILADEDAVAAVMDLAKAPEREPNLFDVTDAFGGWDMYEQMRVGS